MRSSPPSGGAWDRGEEPPRAIVRAMPVGVLLFAVVLALPAPANASIAALHGSVAIGAPPRSGLAWVHLRSDNFTGPGARDAAGLSDGPQGNGTLLFGGCGPAQCPMNDTWSFSAGVWTNLSAGLSVAPPARSGAVLAEDPSSGGVLLFGGCAANGSALGDTWLFLDGRWSPVNTSFGAPPARCDAMGASDPTLDGVVVFGGIGSSGAARSDLWLFSDGAWTELDNGSAGPAARSAGALAVDPVTGDLVLFGGLSANGSTLADTETFAEGAWTAVVPFASGAPPGRSGAVFSDDPSLGTDLLFGGTNGSTTLGDTWSYAGGLWTNLTAAVAHPPPGRTAAAGVYDASDAYELMIGGRSAPTVYRNETWALVPPLNAELRLPTAAASPGGVIHFNATVSGGLPPYRFNWSFGVPGHNVRLPAPYFAYDSVGSYAINLTVLDSRGVAVYANGSVAVAPVPLTVALSATPSEADPGTPVELRATVSGGTAPFSASWSGLPTGCVGNASLSIRCTVTGTGEPTVTVRVVDARGDSASARTTVLIASALTGASGVANSGSAAAFQHLGWVLVPPLAGAVLMAAYAAYVTFRVNRYEATHPPPPRPDCYVPPEWSETPGAFDEASGRVPPAGRT